MSLLILRYQQKNKYFNFFQCLLESLCPFKNKFECLHVVSYKCKYLLFHLDMLKLFQKINILFIFWRLSQFPIKKSPLNTQDLIPTYLADLMFIHPNCLQNFNELKTGMADQISPWMIIGQYFVQFESYIYMKITKFSNVNLYFFFVISSSLLVHSSMEPKFIK